MSMSNKVVIITPKKKLEMFRDWFNNFSTITRFAEYYGLSEENAQAVIGEGRILHDTVAEILKNADKSKGHLCFYECIQGKVSELFEAPNGDIYVAQLPSPIALDNYRVSARKLGPASIKERALSKVKFV